MDRNPVLVADRTETANDRFKATFRSWFWGGLSMAAVAHFALLAFFPTLNADDPSSSVHEVEMIELPPELDIPPPPEQIYPAMLRDAGIGGTVQVWFYIDETGRVVETRLHQSSGRSLLDSAALRVAELYRFSPAQNRDQPVAVWVSIPIRFQTR